MRKYFMLRGGLPKEFGNRLEEHFDIFFHHVNMCQPVERQISQQAVLERKEGLDYAA
jgi:hypothetical protein